MMQLDQSFLCALTRTYSLFMLSSLYAFKHTYSPTEDHTLILFVDFKGIDDTFELLNFRAIKWMAKVF